MEVEYDVARSTFYEKTQMEDGLLPPGKSLCTLLPLLMASSMPDPVVGREVALRAACSIVSSRVQWF